MEQTDYNVLFRWFVGLDVDDPVWDHSTSSFNRQRLFDEAIAQRFFEHTLLLARLRELVSDEHFSVDGTLLAAWASHKSFRPKDGVDDEMVVTSTDKSVATTRMPPRPTPTRLVRKGAGKEARPSIWRIP